MLEKLITFYFSIITTSLFLLSGMMLITLALPSFNSASTVVFCGVCSLKCTFHSRGQAGKSRSNNKNSFFRISMVKSNCIPRCKNRILSRNQSFRWRPFIGSLIAFAFSNQPVSITLVFVTHFGRNTLSTFNFNMNYRFKNICPKLNSCTFCRYFYISVVEFQALVKIGGIQKRIWS